MQINWFTVIAQILNFLVLVWLMKRYLYKPILDAIDEREKKIKSELQDAVTKKAEAKSEQDEFNQKNQAFDKEKKDLTDKAIAEANEQRGKLLEQAQNDANTLSSKREKALQEMQEDSKNQIMQRIQQDVFAVARKALADLASQSLEEQSVNIFIKRLNEIKENEKDPFVAAMQSGSDPILVQSVFDLPEKQQTEIKDAVNKILGTKPQFEFKTSPEIIAGIELITKGYKLAWSISEYINSFEKSIIQTKQEKPEPVPA